MNQPTHARGKAGFDDVARANHVDRVHLRIRFPPRRNLARQVKNGTRTRAGLQNRDSIEQIRAHHLDRQAVHSGRVLVHQSPHPPTLA